MPDYVDKIVIVNDASSDNTAQKVTEYASNNSRVVLLNHENNQGVGGAIATGYKWARDQDFDAAVVMAGDGQMCPSDLPSLLDPIVNDESDYTKGNRLFHADSDKIPKIRFFGNAVLSLLTKIASGYWHVMDSQTGYTVINKKALHTINWDKMYKRYGQPNDLLVRLNVYNFRVRDVLIKPVYNIGEKSGIKIKKVLFTISRLLARMFFWRLKEKYILRDFHPLVLFYFLAFLLGGVSFILFIRLVVLWIDYTYVPQTTLLALLFAAAMSLQSLFFAMWLDADYNKHLK
jgi:glycosyltransferase involved in cell wall biosynthesis